MLPITKRFILSKKARVISQCFSSSRGFQNKFDGDRTMNNDHDFKPYFKIIGVSLGVALAFKIYDYSKYFVRTEAAAVDAGTEKKHLPYYSLSEVAKHTEKEKGIWVIYKDGVYDITDFVQRHPGGDQILLAAGNSVEPFWALYALHITPQILGVLESLRIGNVSKEEAEEENIDQFDPFSTDPIRNELLQPALKKPFCAEISSDLLIQNFITPNEYFYVRNHLPVPVIDPATFELAVDVEGEEDKSIVLSLDELKELPKITITATIMCAGNRRSEMTKVKAVKGLTWSAGAVGNARWTGVRLRDLLKKAGVDEDDERFKHVHFEGVDLDPAGKAYGASIPFWKAMDKRSDVILAYEMNGVSIPRDHGFPLRVIVPGVAGARNVKWLERIIVSERESDSHWQKSDYKGFSPGTDYSNVDYSKSPAIQELPVISAICTPMDGQSIKIENGHVLVKGYAWSGGGQKIIRVDITADGGNTWHVANLDHQDSADPPHHWSWTLWSVQIPLKAGTKNIEIWAKAVDSSYNTQPENFKNIWNFRGVLCNAYHRVSVKIVH